MDEANVPVIVCGALSTTKTPAHLLIESYGDKKAQLRNKGAVLDATCSTWRKLPPQSIFYIREHLTYARK